MSQRKRLNFPSEYELIAHLELLRKGYKQHGNWSLPMICQHINFRGPLKPPASPKATPQQAEAKKFIDYVLSNKKAPPGFEAPPENTPRPDAAESQVDRFRDFLVALKNYPHDLVDFGPFGPVPTNEVRQLMLAHAAHHLSFLEPTSIGRRADVRFADEDAVIAELNRLRKGCVQAGSWSLPQIAWHLNQAVQARMKPGPHPDDTAEQKTRKPLAQHVISMNGYLPSGMTAPDPMQPPADAPASTVDDLIASLKKLKAFKGEIAPHRIFGRLSDADARRLNLIHCAHHISYLTPAEN